MLILLEERRNHQEPFAATHVRFSNDAELLVQMTKCNAGGDPTASATFAQMMNAWAKVVLPEHFIREDLSGRDSVGDFWVTGDTCRAPE